MTETKPAINSFYPFFQRISPENAKRAMPFLQRVLDAWENGHSFIELNEEEQALALGLSPLIGVADEKQALLLLQDNRLFLHKIYDFEYTLACRLYDLCATPLIWAEEGDLLQEYFSENSDNPLIIKSNLQQKNAVKNALRSRFSLISGGPGTGKTTTVAKLLALLCHQAKTLPRIALSAPTGKAAAHLQQSLMKGLERISFRQPEIKTHLSQLQGQTLHRLLKIYPPFYQSEYNQQNNLPYDIVIIDESSMIELNIAYQLSNAIGKNTRLILLGDKDQLPSVGAGAVLEQISQIDEKSVLSDCISHLTVSRRFDENSGIGVLASAIIEHNPEKALNCFQKFSNEIIQKNDSQQLCEEYYHLQKDYWQAIEEKNINKAFELFYTTMVLCVLRSDAQRFNRQFLDFLMHKGHGKGFFNGKAIMITENNVTLDIYNGDIGIVFDKKVYFPNYQGHIKEIEPARINHFEDAFAITVHKSQGSEYNHIFLITPKKYIEDEEQNSEKIFDRSLLYTAVTRSKKTFCYIGDDLSLQNAILRQNKRRSLLKQLAMSN
ncbi:MAG: exodeoxyribonuclease V subunit alpha [Neisseriaceae bacterium]|nr:exodeoxyribonuclease V subunit alpha [Neisseriaceae bacterium]